MEFDIHLNNNNMYMKLVESFTSWRADPSVRQSALGKFLFNVTWLLLEVERNPIFVMQLNIHIYFNTAIILDLET